MKKKHLSMLKEVFKNDFINVFNALNTPLTDMPAAIEAAKAAKSVRLFSSSTKKADLESEITKAENLYKEKLAAAYSAENAQALVNAKAALAQLVEDFKAAIKAEVLVDIDFENASFTKHEDPSGENDTYFTLAGKVGEMKFSSVAENNALGTYYTEGKYAGKFAGTIGTLGCYSFNGNKIITGTSGGIILTDDHDDYLKAKKMATQSRENAPWYQHTEIGYNYRISNIVAGVIRGQLPYLDEHISQKKAVYERYKEGFRDLPVKMNPCMPGSEPNYWLSCMTIDPEAMCEQTRGDLDYTYKKENGKTCPMEILDAIKTINAEGRPLWKPMHLQPVYGKCDSVCVNGCVSEDLFNRGICLPSDIKMTEEQQDAIINVVRACFE